MGHGIRLEFWFAGTISVGRIDRLSVTDTELADLFRKPQHLKQRQYEALRARFVDRAPYADIAMRLGLNAESVHNLAVDLRKAGRLTLFDDRGVSSDVARRNLRIVELRRAERLSNVEIAERMQSEGLPVGTTTIGRVLKQAGYGKLPRRALRSWSPQLPISDSSTCSPGVFAPSSAASSCSRAIWPRRIWGPCWRIGPPVGSYRALRWSGRCWPSSSGGSVVPIGSCRTFWTKAARGLPDSTCCPRSPPSASTVRVWTMPTFARSCMRGMPSCRCSCPRRPPPLIWTSIRSPITGTRLSRRNTSSPSAAAGSAAFWHWWRAMPTSACLSTAMRA